jgi:hypothetical protein
VIERASSTSPAEASEYLQDVIERLRLHGGQVEFDIPRLGKAPGRRLGAGATSDPATMIAPASLLLLDHV